MNYVVGLTGGIGSGKTTISNFFKLHDLLILDADEISKKLVQPNTTTYLKILDYFGSSVIEQDGNLNRKLLRLIVFNSNEKRAWLESLMHPLIVDEVLQQSMQKTSSPYIIWSVPLLIENNLHKKCNRVLVIDVLPEIQIQRCMKRDGNTTELTLKILDNQISRKERLSYADDIIENNLPLEINSSHLKKQVALLHAKYSALAQTSNK